MSQVKEWSTYQVALFDAVKALREQPSGALMVKAVAGSGKTTSIVESMKLVKTEHRVVYLVFNKHNAESAKGRVPFNVEVATINGYGFRAIREAFRGCKLDDWKTRNAMRDVVADQDDRRRWDGPMKRLISLKKATMMEAAEVAKRYDLDLPTEGRFMEAAAMVWKHVTSQTMIIDFDDQWFLPVVKKLPIPQYDWVFVDEAQDLSATQIELVKRIAPRIVAVGDPRQAIYGFRGADPSAMDNMEKALGAKVMPLSICYRCPKSVVERAARVIEPDVIEAAPSAAEGVIDEVPIDLLRKEAAPGSWVLCRTTAPLVRECLKFIVAGVKATVRGRDIGQQLASLVEKVGGVDAVDFTMRLDEWSAKESARLAAAQRDAQLQALEDRVETLHALAEGARTVDDVLARIDNVFKEEASGVTFATAHRAKGLEADDVYILCPELMPFPKAKSDWQRVQERNLQYVAYTRAMKRLRFVTGTERKKSDVQVSRNIAMERAP